MTQSRQYDSKRRRNPWKEQLNHKKSSAARDSGRSHSRTGGHGCGWRDDYNRNRDSLRDHCNRAHRDCRIWQVTGTKPAMSANYVRTVLFC